MSHATLAADRWPRTRERRDRAPSLAANVGPAPILYSLAVPLAVLHAWVWTYERVCFRLWRIPYVNWTPYVVVDRYRLPYLSPIERLNCAYCGYANALLAYVREVAARTEAYWCPIQHGRAVRDPHRLYRSFARYGDARGYRAYVTARQDLASVGPRRRARRRRR